MLRIAQVAGIPSPPATALLYLLYCNSAAPLPRTTIDQAHARSRRAGMGGWLSAAEAAGQPIPSAQAGWSKPVCNRITAVDAVVGTGEARRYRQPVRNGEARRYRQPVRNGEEARRYRQPVRNEIDRRCARSDHGEQAGCSSSRSTSASAEPPMEGVLRHNTVARLHRLRLHRHVVQFHRRVRL